MKADCSFNLLFDYDALDPEDKVSVEAPVRGIVASPNTATLLWGPIARPSTSSTALFENKR